MARLEAQGSKPPECACPGLAPQSLRLPLVSLPASPGKRGASETAPSNLVNWPIQLHLVPPDAAFLRQADVVLVADCVPLVYANLHGEIIRGRPVLIGCPKLDDTGAYVEKLADILSTAQIRGLSIVRMEVPCCAGLMRIAEAAQQRAGRRCRARNSSSPSMGSGLASAAESPWRGLMTGTVRLAIKVQYRDFPDERKAPDQAPPRWHASPV